MCAANWRYLVTEYIRENAKPVDKFSHQPRLYALAARLAEGQPYDDDVLFAAAWMHDLGVFIGHRPEELAALAAWDNTKYAIEKSPEVLVGFGFPAEKVPAVADQPFDLMRARLQSSLRGAVIRKSMDLRCGHYTTDERAPGVARGENLRVYLRIPEWGEGTITWRTPKRPLNSPYWTIVSQSCRTRIHLTTA